MPYHMIDIHNRNDIRSKLNLLSADTAPLFGKMSPQHMVEHLSFALKFSNGTLPQTCYYPEKIAQRIKASVIESDKELPVGFKAPMLDDDPPELTTLDLETARVMLFSELELFDTHFTHHRDATPINPTMGALNYSEWVVFHNKHFNHHFKQFGLV
jgi:hypothetical protein